MSARHQTALRGNRCQCPTCGEYFSRVRAFDRHRTGPIGIGRRCLTGAEMIARGWQRNATGCWVIATLDCAGRRRFAATGTSPQQKVAGYEEAANGP